MDDGQGHTGRAMTVEPGITADVAVPPALDIVSLLAVSGCGSFQVTAAGQILHISDRLAALIGIASSDAKRSAGKRDGWDKLIPPARLSEFLGRLRQAGQIAGFEIEAPVPAGGVQCWLSIDAWSVRDGAGAIVRYEGLVRDVSAEKRMAGELERSEARFRDLCTTSNDSYWETGPDHRLTLVAANGAERGDGADPIGRARWDLSADTAAEARKWRDFRRLLERREPFADFRYRLAAPAGARVVSVSGVPVFGADRTFLGYRGSARNMTEIECLRAAHEDGQRRLRNFSAAASDFFWETDEQHRFVAIPDLGTAGAGPPTPLVGKTRWEIADDLAEDAAKWAAHRAALERREPFRNFVFRFRASNGERHWASTSGIPVLAPDGAFRGYRGASRLITEEIRHAEQLRAAKAQADAAGKSKSAILSRMSHDIRTSLNAIIGFSDIMGREMFGKIGTLRYAEYVGDIRDSARGLLKLVDNIADLNDAVAGRIVLEDMELDLSAALRSAVLMLREPAKRRLVQVSESVAPDLPMLKGDRRRVRQILLALLSNAIRLSPRSGKVTIGAGSTADGCIFLRLGGTGDNVGAADPVRAIERFGELDTALQVGDDDSGLSFALCKELVELHGGTLRIGKGADHGFFVEILFPRVRSIARPAGRVRDGGKARGKTARDAADVPA